MTEKQEAIVLTLAVVGFITLYFKVISPYIFNKMFNGN